LLIARGANIVAQGTPSQPIIFTSVADEISQADVAAGNFASPNLDPTINSKINRVTAPGVVFDNIILDVDTVENYVNGVVPPLVVAGKLPKANTSTLGWTWAKQAGKF